MHDSAAGQIVGSNATLYRPWWILEICQFRYNMPLMSKNDKLLILLNAEIKSPPFSKAARLEAGFLIRPLQHGRLLGLPHSRPMPILGARCHELRITDLDKIWRIFYRADSDAIVVIEVIAKKTPTTPKPTIDLCIARLKRYDDETK